MSNIISVSSANVPDDTEEAIHSPNAFVVGERLASGWVVIQAEISKNLSNEIELQTSVGDQNDNLIFLTSHARIKQLLAGGRYCVRFILFRSERPYHCSPHDWWRCTLIEGNGVLCYSIWVDRNHCTRRIQDIRRASKHVI